MGIRIRIVCPSLGRHCTFSVHAFGMDTLSQTPFGFRISADKYGTNFKQLYCRSRKTMIFSKKYFTAILFQLMMHN